MNRRGSTSTLISGDGKNPESHLSLLTVGFLKETLSGNRKLNSGTSLSLERTAFSRWERQGGNRPFLASTKKKKKNKDGLGEKEKAES